MTINKWQRYYDAALARELTRIGALRNMESRARAVKRAIKVTRAQEKELLRMRDDIVVYLVEGHNWTHAKAGTYFGVVKQRVDQIMEKHQSLSTEATSTEGTQPLVGAQETTEEKQ